MYSPHSPPLHGDRHSFGSSINHHSPSSHYNHQFNSNLQQSQYSASPGASYSTTASSSINPTGGGGHHYQSTNEMSPVAAAAAAAAAAVAANSSSRSIQCLRFKYFTTFFICTTCLGLLSASLATHKWLVSRPIRVLRLNNGQMTNFTALMLTASQDLDNDNQLTSSSSINGKQIRQSRQQSNQHQQASQQQQFSDQFVTTQNGNKFQGEIYFGLFNGVKVLNYGFGDRISQLSVTQTYYTRQSSPDSQVAGQNPHELVNFRFWLTTLTGVSLAILFALIGSIFAIINFVMTPRGTITGPVGLVLWNAAACFSCLLAMFAWLVEYFLRLKTNVLTLEEVQNGWTSDSRSQFGYSYYFVVLAFVLHLINIFIISIVQAETWNNHSIKMTSKRQSRASACEGVIMLY